MAYIELPSDHAFSAFLATLKRSRVLREREAMFSRQERERSRFLVQKSRVERGLERQAQIDLALAIAAEMKEAS